MRGLRRHQLRGLAAVGTKGIASVGGLACRKLEYLYLHNHVSRPVPAMTAPLNLPLDKHALQSPFIKHHANGSVFQPQGRYSNSPSCHPISTWSSFTITSQVHIQTRDGVCSDLLVRASSRPDKLKHWPNCCCSTRESTLYFDPLPNSSIPCLILPFVLANLQHGSQT
jgi:hypothetical protein